MCKRYFISFFLLGFFLQSQELPPIKNYTPLDYDGENQNWSIVQGSDGHVYIANNHNLLEFDGIQWTKHKSGNASIYRSVAANDSLIFTGQYREFGYWKKNCFGNLDYTSISATLKERLLEDEEFWNIVVLDDWVLFQSLDRIYSYNITATTFKILGVKSTKAHLFKVGHTVYYQNQDLGIYKIENGRPKLVIHQSLMDGQNVVGIYGYDDEIMVILDNAIFFQLKAGKPIPWEEEKLDKLSGLNVYSTTQLQDGSFVLGTISSGIYQIGTDGTIIRSIDQQKGLYNNTVLSLFQDRDKNLWLGLDNGLSVVNMDSHFNEYIDNTGKLGQVYTSKLYKDRLYLGTNQGLFVRSDANGANFNIIKGTDGQVWSLVEAHGTLFCGHNKGTFIIDGERAEQVSTLPGTWSVKTVEGEPDLLMQGNYDGLSLLEKINGKWSFRNTIKGFSISSRFFEVLKDKKVLVNHEYKGVYHLALDDGYQNVIKEETLPIMGYGSSIVRYQDQIIYTSLDGAFKKQKDSFSFYPDTTLLKLLFEKAGGVTSIAIPDAQKDRLWCYTPGGLSYVQPETFNASLNLGTVPVPSFFRGSLGVSGFENLVSIDNEKYVLGISNGFVVLDLDKLKDSTFRIQINGAHNQKGIEGISVMDLTSETELEHGYNSITFSYVVPQFDKYTEVDYQYRLKGLFEEWGSFAKKNETTFSNLKFGTYEFQVRAKVGNTMTENIATHTFKIKRPWYLSTMAVLLYVVLISGLFFAIHKLYKSYYTQKQKRILDLEKKKQKRKKLKAEKELIQLRNDKLKAEVDSKNRELAVATMSIIKKNEFLSTIKSQLNKIMARDADVRSVIRTIDGNINNEDDWQFFEKAFNNADKGFMKKIKVAHPELTPSDLKLCAYLRLNLSTKEIAPLLNISVKSVEVKRHRLRKKMDLSREVGLTEHIMSL